MTATLIEGDVDTTIITEEFFDVPPQCEGVDEQENDCEIPAEFKTHTVCCGQVLTFCEDCLYLVLAIMKNIPDHTYNCVHCGTKVGRTDSHLVVDGRI